MIDHTGQRLGNYRLVRSLGRGGFAQVYLAEHLRLGTQAAIKLLSTHLIKSDVEKFLAEARTIARLEHLHIIRILDFDVEYDIPFLVMSYAPNGTMRSRFSKGTPLASDILLKYLKQAASALQYAHDTKLIHRDIKPENMLLGRHDELLLSDFGIAVVAHSSISQNTQEVIGTISYMAPEQIQGKPRPASDQYALGVIVYEWLCGQRPFHGTTAEIVTQHLHADPPSLQGRTPGISPELEAVVFTALEKDPHKRFANIQDFAHAFELAYGSIANATTAGLSDARALSVTRLPGRSYASQTQAEHRRRGISRRTVLLGTLGTLGLGGTCGGLAWVLAQKSPLGTTLVTYQGHLSAVTTVSWSPDGKRIASGSGDQTVQLWDATGGTHPFIYRGHTTNVNAVAWSPDGQHIASASGNNFFRGEHVVRVWNAATGDVISVYQGHTQPVRTVAWSPDGKYIASGSEDKMVHIWEAINGNRIQSYSGHTAIINAVAWSPSDGRYIASTSDDKTMQLWDAHTATRVFSFEHPSTVNAVAWSPNGSRIATASGNVFFGGEATAHVWDVATRTLIQTFRGHTTPVNTVAWSPDSKHIASASSSIEKTVLVWNATNGTVLYTYRGHTLGVTSVAWSPDGQYIASGSLDGTVRVWQATPLQ